jgi:hypothetical protein
MTTKSETRPFRTTATIVGIVYIAGFVVGIGGNILVQSNLSAPNYLSTISANSLMVAMAQFCG